MKTHEFARYLEQLARLLRQLPDTELDPKRSADLQALMPGGDPNAKARTRLEGGLPEKIAAKLREMSPAEIETYLLSDEEAFTVVFLSALADHLGLTSQKRQSKNALVNMITRHFEATKMHSIMRGTRPSEN
ncbi:hypothetical protein [Hydrogenophaga sp. MI9]|uniref:hypothetical protein n=1 Tax=Hydrogenophaga sp. MI9 TaxID=3453719 RepID=UPI003EE9B559